MTLCLIICSVGQRYILNNEYKGSLTCEELGTVLFVMDISGGWQAIYGAAPDLQLKLTATDSCLCIILFDATIILR